MRAFLRKTGIAAGMAALVGGIFFALAPELTTPAVAERLPLDDRGNVVPVLKFGGPNVTQTVTYDSTSRRGSSPDYVFESGSVGTTIIRIWCDTDAHVRIGTSLDAVITATTRDTPISAGLPAFAKITTSNDRFAVVQKSSAGTCWFTPLE